MAETPAAAHKSSPLKHLFQNLNDPESDDIEEEAVLADLEVLSNDKIADINPPQLKDNKNSTNEGNNDGEPLPGSKKNNNNLKNLTAQFSGANNANSAAPRKRRLSTTKKKNQPRPPKNGDHGILGMISNVRLTAKISILSCVPLREFTRLIVNQAVLFRSLAISLHKDNIRCAWNQDLVKVRRR
jgi:hypothetical protein